MNNKRCPFFFIPIGKHFKLGKKDTTVYVKTSTDAYTKVNDNSGIETIMPSIAQVVTPYEYVDFSLQYRKDIIEENITPFILIRFDQQFKFLWGAGKVYTKTGFRTYTGKLQLRGKNKFEIVTFTKVDPIDDPMEVI